MAAVDVVRPDGGREAVIGSIREGERFFSSEKRMTETTGPKISSRAMRHAAGHIGKYGRLDE